MNDAAIRESFVKQADSVWVPVINKALDNCFTLLSKSPPKPAIKAGDQTCMQGPAELTACVRRYLVKDCPAEMKSEQMKNGKNFC
ncbi:hypothetical protein B566_EDAN009453 [Ephemera danica]|nr:hypothetical protein B566_EDAN009453 [Ephemera danica]